MVPGREFAWCHHEFGHLLLMGTKSLPATICNGVERRWYLCSIDHDDPLAPRGRSIELGWLASFTRCQFRLIACGIGALNVLSRGRAWSQVAARASAAWSGAGGFHGAYSQSARGSQAPRKKDP
jgi:hypothetical protein